MQRDAQVRGAESAIALTLANVVPLSMSPMQSTFGSHGTSMSAIVNGVDVTDAIPVVDATSV